MRVGLLVWGGVIVATAFGLYQVELTVRDLDRQLDSLDATIERNREAVHMLKAEWSYLNDPRRLAELSSRYLDLAPVRPEQLAVFDDLPVAPVGGPTGAPEPIPYAAADPALPPAPTAIPASIPATLSGGALDPDAAAVLSAMRSRQ
jgi:hypothetical protein